MAPKLSMLSRSVEGRVVLITGAASGMGRAEALLFADEGARVAVVDRDGPGAEAVAATIVAAYGEGAARPWAVDLAEPAAITALVADVVATLGPIDILVNNAGIALPALLEGDDDAYESAWAATLAVNLTAHERMARACLPHLIRNGDGRVVNIASTEGLGASRYNSPYVAAKHGVIGLTKALAVELGAKGVTANAVCPGPIRTNMTAPIPDDAKDKFAKRMVPARRYGDPEEVAHVVLSLCLPAASFCNGAVVVVDGGMLAKND
jgi:3-oxoacyl-[acyl-carrier protein] reductase